MECSKKRIRTQEFSGYQKRFIFHLQNNIFRKICDPVIIIIGTYQNLHYRWHALYNLLSTIHPILANQSRKRLEVTSVAGTVVLMVSDGHRRHKGTCSQQLKTPFLPWREKEVTVPRCQEGLDASDCGRGLGLH
jgi:hypothetical protein